MLLLTLALAADDTGYVAPSGLPGAGTTDAARSQTSTRFVVFGDWGNGGTTQQDVADAMSEVCALYGCDFVVGVGDNFYPSGTTGVDDPYWNDRFEAIYDLEMPFYMTLGNHDWGGGGGGYDVDVAQAEVDYTAYSDRWTMPDKTWTQVVGDVTLLGIDTTTILKNYGSAQAAWLPGEIAAATTTWTIVVGHHPYQSNGPHGDAGTYDGSEGLGQNVKDFFDAYICGQVDLYLAGHDHLLEWPVSSCGSTELMVSGGGGSHAVLEGTDPANFEAASAGFLWIEIVDRVLTATFYDETATELYTGTIVK